MLRLYYLCLLQLKNTGISEVFWIYILMFRVTPKLVSCHAAYLNLIRMRYMSAVMQR